MLLALTNSVFLRVLLLCSPDPDGTVPVTVTATPRQPEAHSLLFMSTQIGASVHLDLPCVGHHPSHITFSPWVIFTAIPQASNWQNEFSSWDQRTHRRSFILYITPLFSGRTWIFSVSLLGIFAAGPCPSGCLPLPALTDESHSTRIFTIQGTVQPLVDGNLVNVATLAYPGCIMRKMEFHSGLEFAESVGICKPRASGCEEDLSPQALGLAAGWHLTISTFSLSLWFLWNNNF